MCTLGVQAARCTGATLGKRYLRVYPAAAVACFRLGPSGGREKRLSGLDLSQRLRSSRSIHMARFSGPGDHSGPISDHVRRFGHFGPDPYMRLQHWHSALAFNIDIQHWHSTLAFNIGVQHRRSTLAFDIGIRH